MTNGDDPEQCPRCGRALADYVCLHCAADDTYGDAALVRRFVSRPDLYSSDTTARLWPTADPPAFTEPVPERVPFPAVQPGLPAPAARPRRQSLDPTGWGPRGIAAKTVIAGGSILIATVVGIVGAVVAGPVPGAPRSSAMPAPPSAAVTGRVVQGLLCLAASAPGVDSGGPIELGRCGSADGQQWTFDRDGTVRALGKCMRPVGNASAYGTKVELRTCDRSASEQWFRGPDGRLVHRASGACLEGPAPDAGPGTQPQLAVCGNAPGQRWDLP